MKQGIYILLLILSTSVVYAQRTRGRGPKLPEISTGADSTHMHDTTHVNDIKTFRLARELGDYYLAPMDTNRFNFAQNTFVEGQSLSMAYLANMGAPGQTRIFSERKEQRDFIFADPYDAYITTPENADFYDTKIPYTHILYTFNGSDQKKEERLKGIMTVNFGKNINIGGEIDYIYGRGHYASNGNKLLSYRLFGGYRNDKYEMKAYLSNFNFINHENGGLTEDRMITNPEDYSENNRVMDTKSYSVRYNNVFNRVRGKQYFLNHRYNLGFYKTTETYDEEGNITETEESFVPVSSIIHTLSYEDNERHFTTPASDLAAVDTSYWVLAPNNYGELTKYNRIYGLNNELHDRPSAWKLRNTFALSLREGFQDWVKFGLSAFVALEKRQFKMMAAPKGVVYNDRMEIVHLDPNFILYPGHQIYDEFSTYIGGELSKKEGDILTYNAYGELCVVGDDLGEFRLSGDLQTKFNLFKKEASVQAEGYIKNIKPAFFMRHNHSRYFWWDNHFKNEQQIYVGGTVKLENTRTQLSAGINSLQNHVYAGSAGVPEQFDGNLQVLSFRAKQDFIFKGFGWENEAAYQLSSNQDVIPLPQFSLHSNIYTYFKYAQVLTIQIGADVHYFSSYYAPYYEPATQLFQLQANDDRKTKIGNYPLINAYVNFHLKQARFFISAYNIGTQFLDPKHFSLAHYPLNPFLLKMGIAVYFNN